MSQFPTQTTLIHQTHPPFVEVYVAVLTNLTKNVLVKGEMHNSIRSRNLIGSANFHGNVYKTYPFSPYPSSPHSLALATEGSGNETNHYPELSQLRTTKCQ